MIVQMIVCWSCVLCVYYDDGVVFVMIVLLYLCCVCVCDCGGLWMVVLVCGLCCVWGGWFCVCVSV